MNICFLIYNISRSGGSERVTSIIADNLARNGHKVFILSLCGNNESYYKISNNVEIFSIFKNKNSINHKKLYIYLIKRIYKYYKEKHIDISIEVFASLSLFVLPIKKFLKIKNITWEHFNFKTKSGLNSFARKLACKYSDQIITLTNRDKEEYEKKIKKIKCKMDFIYNPTPFPYVTKSKLENNTIITVGRLTYQKGFDMLLDVWNIVEKKNKDWNLLIYGTGEDEEKLKEKKQKLNLKNVTFKGITKNIGECYKNASIFISTSRWEGLPMCMIEAQSYGLPIISFDYETGPSEIIDNNVNGILVENGNIKLMAQRLLNMIDNRKLLKEFQNNINNSEKFNTKSIINKWESVLKSLK